MSDTHNHWIVTASADHAARGRVEGIVQAGHGKASPLRRMRPGDGVVIYSSRLTYPDGPPLQAFTLIGHVADVEPYSHEVGDMLMWRRPVLWRDSVMADIRPMLDKLEVTRGLASWGMAFRYGLTRISRADFALIAGAMLAMPAGAGITA
ncbi:MAG: EVE domain-containing protein [bacterium]